MKHLRSISGKFLLITALVLLVVFAALFWYRYQSISRSIEEQFSSQGKALALSLSQSIKAVTEQDLKNGVTLNDNRHITGSQLDAMLFNDQLKPLPENGEIAKKRLQDPDYAKAKQLLHDGSTIPMSEYEMKYTSEFDVYTDQRWQGLLDSFLATEGVVFALATFYSDKPKVAGYIPTHNTIYSPIGDASKDKWGDTGIVSQKYRANRVFNDPTGYRAAAYMDTKEPLVQSYPRVIEGKTVMMWDISYPIILNGKHWGGVRVALSQAKADEAVAKQHQQLIMQYAFLFVVIITLLYFLTRLLVKRRVNALKEITQRIFASGTVDLEQRFNERGSDEISSLSRELNQLLIMVKNMVTNLKTMSAEVADSSRLLSAGSEQMNNMAGIVLATMQELNSGAKVQAQGAKEGAAAMEEMALGIQKIAQSSGLIKESSANVVSQVKHSDSSIGTVMTGMNELLGTTRSTMDTVTKLQSVSSEIGSFATFITAISNQTNILSLNASIEASRSGEHGKGFAVIADEIRKLAVQSKESASKITEMIEEIQYFTHQTVKSMAANSDNVSGNVATVSQVTDVLKQIVQVTSSVDGHLLEVTHTSEQVSSGIQEVTAAISEMAHIAGQSARHVQDTVDKFQEQLLVMKQMSQSAEALNGLAERLKQNIALFK